MEYSFNLNIKPFSVNSYHYSDKRHKTAEARAWEGQVRLELEEHAKQLNEMADDWRKSGGHFILKFHAYYPTHVFYTQSGEISGRTIDVSNFEKPLQDLVFKQLDLNDKLVKRLVSEKSAGTYHYINVSIKLVYKE